VYYFYHPESESLFTFINDTDLKRGMSGDRSVVELTKEQYLEKENERKKMTKTKTKSNFNADRLKERIENAGKTSDTFWYLKLPEGLKSFKTIVGDNFIRPLPPTDDADDFAFDIHVHYGIGVEQYKSAFLCREKMLGEACPVCEESRKLIQAGRGEDAKAFKITSRTLVFVIDRDKQDEGVKLYDAPTSSVGHNLVALCQNRRTRKMLDISDPLKGFDAIIVREGLGVKNTKYTSVQLDHPSTPLGSAKEIEEFLEAVPTFKEVLAFQDYETMKAEMTGGVRPEHDDEPEDVPEDEVPTITDADTGSDEEVEVADECPEGFDFAADYDAEEECADCKKDNKATWRACRKAHKALNDEIPF